MKFIEISNTKLTESFDNPYPFELIGPNDSQEFSALAQTPNGMLRMDFEATDYDNFGIDFSVGKSMGKTDAGDEFKVFATVVAMMKKWIKTVGIEHVESFDFGANKGEHASDGRAKLYTRFAKKLASQLGWKLEQSTTADRSTAFFRLVNPKPVPREQEYWDALDESKINENVSALQAELEQKYNLKSLFLADMGKRNAIELHSIIVNKEEQGSGTGSKVMQEIIAYADDNGKIVVLDPGLLDKQHGTTSQSRLRKFYKRFGFIDNKGRNKNYEFRNLMIRYPQSNESVNEVSKEEFDAIQNGYVDIEFDKKWWPLNDDYPLIKHIGKAIGATSWTSWGKVGVPWSETEMIGGGGTYMLKGDFGHILLDAAKSFRPEQILMAQISTSNRGGGVGVKVMNAIKSYADQKGLPITIYKVTNKKFFDKFEWLTKTGEDTYEYKLNESINEGYNPYPVKTLKGLYHVGTMDSSKKRDGYEGAGISVSTHPDAWRKIARGHVTGDTHSATKEGNKFLDAHNLSDTHKEEIKQWAIKNDYLAQQETVTVCYYDDEMEDDLCSTFNSMADAEAEYDDELEFMDVSVDKGGIVPTDKLKKETRQNRIESTGVLEFVLPIFAEQQGLDGVWWQDKLDVNRYSAPRGVIVPSKIKSWKFAVKKNESVNEGYKLQLERDADMMVLNITDTATGKRTEVRGKSGYETGNYDANDKLHQLLDRIGKASNISELINGEVVGINPKHPDGKNAKTATDTAFNEAAGVGRVVKGVNTTVDVGVDEIIKQVKKFGNDVNRDGIPTKNLKTK